MSVFALTAKAYPAMDEDNEDKQFLWHRRLLHTHGCLYTLVGKSYIFYREMFRELHAAGRDLCHSEKKSKSRRLFILPLLTDKTILYN